MPERCRVAQFSSYLDVLAGTLPDGRAPHGLRRSIASVHVGLRPGGRPGVWVRSSLTGRRRALSTSCSRTVLAFDATSPRTLPEARRRFGLHAPASTFVEPLGRATSRPRQTETGAGAKLKMHAARARDWLTKADRGVEMVPASGVAPTSKNTNAPALLRSACGCLLTAAIIRLVCTRVPSAEPERCAQWIPDTIEPGTRVVGGVLGPDTIHREAGS